MSALFVLIALSLLVALGFLGAFLWAARSGQYDDDYTPAVRMLFDDGKRKESRARSQEPGTKTGDGRLETGTAMKDPPHTRNTSHTNTSTH